MKLKKSVVGNWISFYSHLSDCILKGFVLSENDKRSVIEVFVPARDKILIVSSLNYACCEEIELDQHDINTLIDLALDTRDFEWLSELYKNI